MRSLIREQWLPIGLEQAWAFFSTPRNLARITPGDMRFRIHEPFDDRPIHVGQWITYTVRPFFGFPLKWVTRITEVSAPYFFVDEQETGPYSTWRHAHSFEAGDGGTWVRDDVRYEMPLGVLGKVAHGLIAHDKLHRIFDHRRSSLRLLFPGTHQPVTP